MITAIQRIESLILEHEVALLEARQDKRKARKEGDKAAAAMFKADVARIYNHIKGLQEALEELRALCPEAKPAPTSLNALSAKQVETARAKGEPVQIKHKGRVFTLEHSDHWGGDYAISGPGLEWPYITGAISDVKEMIRLCVAAEEEQA